jgi:hypothetical protein
MPQQGTITLVTTKDGGPYASKEATVITATDNEVIFELPNGLSMGFGYEHFLEDANGRQAIDVEELGMRAEGSTPVYRYRGNFA